MQIHRAKNKNTLRPVGLWVGCGGIMGNSFLIHVVRRSICVGLLTVGCLAVSQAASLAKEPAPAAAPPKEARTESSLGERMNANTVSVTSGTPGGTYFRMASDMAFVLASDDLRILPILGQGGGQNAYDIRFLKGVDLGFVRTDTLDQLREDNRLKNIEQHIQYVAKLFN